jgi:UDP-N-acetylmuramoylalanine--D-glutamate ligase
MDVSAINKTRFSIIGGARSGVAVARLLKRHGAEVFLSETAPAEKMQQTIAELERIHVPWEFGGNTPRILEADVVVLSPGVPSDAPVVKGAQLKGLTIVSEVEVASWFCRAPIVAITGTNGKTTTTTLAGRIFDEAMSPAIVAGNIGVAFSQVIDDLTEHSTAILEISSFQLDHIESFRPHVSVLLNITPDHLDRYNHSFEKYIASKCRVFENQQAGDTIVYNADDEATRHAVEQRSGHGIQWLPFSILKHVDEGAFVENKRLVTRIRGSRTDVIATGEINIRGQHNLGNAMAATLVAQVMGLPAVSVRTTLRNFKGVEHRLEFVCVTKGVIYVNDSKATNVESVWYALQSFEQPIVLFLGGRDKGNDYSRLVDLVRRHVKAIVAIGESADKVVSTFKGVVPVTRAGDMGEAVHVAASVASPGDVVLLSPACASFDWFENYEHRGKVFKQLVTAL